MANLLRVALGGSLRVWSRTSRSMASAARQSRRRKRRLGDVFVFARPPRQTADGAGGTGPSWARLMPGQTALEMPQQDFSVAPQALGLAAGPMPWRWVLLMLAATCGLLEGLGLTRVLGADRISTLEALTIALSTLLTAWLAFGCFSAVGGFAALLRAGPSVTRSVSPASAYVPASRTAILLPTYNEDPGLVLSAAEAMTDDLARLERADAFDLYILSDTRDDDVARDEMVGVLRLRARMPHGRVYYRRRVENVDRKAGNIADWVTAHGGAYGQMLVLDADSLMSAETILAMVSQMEADPGLGLLQSVPTIINAQSLFARLQQFSSRLYGPVYATGQALWSGTEGNYWGHNALIRVCAFAESCGLPHLKGRKPFGGHILSHDFVEAALLRRRGWTVRTDATLRGSYEETPPTLIDMALRDRRWCQGNLQHARVLPTAGLHWVSRLHLASGVMAYLTPPLWLVLTALGAAVWPAQHLGAGAHDMAEVMALLALNLSLLLVPKLLALGLALRDPVVRREFGGAGGLLAGSLLENLASLLMTPVTMLMQSAAVADVLLGRDSGWRPQSREGSAISRRDAWRVHRVHVLLGVGGAVGAFVLSKALLFWAGPVFLSLSLSAFLSLHTSRIASPEAIEDGVLATPEERAPPWVVVRARALRQAYALEAQIRREIDRMMRGEAAVYDVAGGQRGLSFRLAA